MSLSQAFWDAVDRLKKYNLNPFSAQNPFGLSGVGGMDANWERHSRDLAATSETVAALAEQVVSDRGAVAENLEAILTAEEATTQARDTALEHASTASKWATLTGAAVAGGAYSSQEWAVGSFVPAGSARLWATKLGGPVDGGEYSAKHHAAAAAGSAQQAANHVASIAGGPVASINGKTGVVTLTSADVGAARTDLANVSKASMKAAIEGSGATLGLTAAQVRVQAMLFGSGSAAFLGKK